MISEGKPVVWLFLYMRYLKERKDINYCPLLKPHLSLTKYSAKKHKYVPALALRNAKTEDVPMYFFKSEKTEFLKIYSLFPLRISRHAHIQKMQL